MTRPAHGTPVGVEIPAKDVARATEFYKAVFGWTFKPSHLGAPAHKIVVFETPGGIFPIGGILRLADEHLTGKGVTKLYYSVDDLDSAIEAIEKHGGKAVGDAIPEGTVGSKYKEALGREFQFFEDTEGNIAAIYAYAK